MEGTFRVQDGLDSPYFESKFLMENLDRKALAARLAFLDQGRTEFPSAVVKTTYFDTRDLNLYRTSREGNFEKTKIRLREYLDAGKGARYALEAKFRKGPLVRKYKLLLFGDDTLEAFTFKELLEQVQEFYRAPVSFFSTVIPDPLFPVLCCSYLRQRFSDESHGLRYNFDSEIRAERIMGRVAEGRGGFTFVPSVFEIKGEGQSPFFPGNKQIKALNVSFSKYSYSMNQMTMEDRSHERTV